MKQFDMGEGIKKYDLYMEMYDSGFTDGVIQGSENFSELIADVQSLKTRIENLYQWLEERKNQKIEILEKAWKDGWLTHGTDAFHGKKTEFKNSQFYQEFMQPNPENVSSELDIETIQ